MSITPCDLKRLSVDRDPGNFSSICPPFPSVVPALTQNQLDY